MSVFIEGFVQGYTKRQELMQTDVSQGMCLSVFYFIGKCVL